MLMSCLRYLALCPCPRCLLLKSKISLIGSKMDTKMRLILVRKDSEARQQKVEKARQLRMHSRSDFSTTASTSMDCLYLICFTNSSSEYLKHSLFIWFGFCMRVGRIRSSCLIGGKYYNLYLYYFIILDHDSEQVSSNPNIW